MTIMLQRTLANVGRMLDITPRGKGPAARRVAATVRALKRRNDLDMIREDVAMVGGDMANAMPRITHGE